MRQAPSQKKEKVRPLALIVAVSPLSASTHLFQIHIFRRDHGCFEVGQRPGGPNELEDVLTAGLGSTVMTNDDEVMFNDNDRH